MIWAHGLPFAPGILRRERAGQPVRPDDEPCLSIALYSKGKQVFYLLRTLGPDQVDRDVFGGVSIARTPGHLGLELDVPCPGGPPLRGTIEISGTDLAVPPAGPAQHRWAPQLVGRAKARLRCGSWEFRLDGRGYHDRNSSALGLSELGISRWIWGRTPHEDGEVVHYLLEPVSERPEQNHVLEIDWNGNVEHRFVEVQRGPEARGTWGLSAPRELTAGGLRIRHVEAFEDGPFYQRWLTRVTGPDGVERTGVGEVVDVERIDRGWMTPLVGMALDGAAPSWFLPLFAGPTHDRLERLARYWGLRR